MLGKFISVQLPVLILKIPTQKNVNNGGEVGSQSSRSLRNQFPVIWAASLESCEIIWWKLLCETPSSNVSNKKSPQGTHLDIQYQTVPSE